MDFSLNGVKISLSFWFFAVLGCYMIFDRTGTGIFVLCAVVIHECGHLLMLCLAGGRISRLILSPFGVRLEKEGALGISRELWIYAGGVLANVVSALICLLFGWHSVFLGASLSMIFFNLLPVSRLDGGVLLRLLLQKTAAPERIDLISRIVGGIVLVPLFALGFLLLRQGNVTLLLTAAYLSFFLLQGD